MKNLLILFAIIALASCKKDECPEPEQFEKRNVEFVFKCDGKHTTTLVFDQDVYKFDADSGTYKLTVEYIERKPESGTHYFYASSKTLHDKPISIKWYYKNTGGETSYGGGFAGTHLLNVRAINLQ